MTLPQVFSFAIIAATMALFVWGRLRYDLVALLALLAAIATGIVAPDKAFSGFSDDIVIIVACALLVSAAVGRSGVIEDGLVRIAPYLTTRTIQVAVLVGTVTALSAFVKNIGALAMLMPVAFSLARKTNGTPSIYLMPMAFGSLLGGIVTLVGTSPNIIVARLRAEIVGEPFSMFDFTPVGIGLAIAGVIFLSLRVAAAAARPEGREHDGCGLHARRLHHRGERAGEIARRRQDRRRARGDGRTASRCSCWSAGARAACAPSERMTIKAGDILLIQGEPAALDRVVDKAKLEARARERPRRPSTRRTTRSA